MGAYVQLMPRMVQRRMEEMESKAAENAKAAEALRSPTEASPTFQSPITSSSPLEQPPLLNPSVTDVRPETQSSLAKPAGLDIPVEVSAGVSKSTAVSELRSSAAAALLPATEAGYLNNTGKGLSDTASLPQLSVAGAQIEPESSTPAFKKSHQTSPSADVPTSTTYRD